MIPVNIADVCLVNFKTSKYKTYYQSEMQYLRSNSLKSEVISKANDVYKIMADKKHHRHKFYAEICCNFKLLEEKCIEWNEINCALSKTQNLDFNELFYIYETIKNKQSFKSVVSRIDALNIPKDKFETAFNYISDYNNTSNVSNDKSIEDNTNIQTNEDRNDY